ncbi:MAG: hypothetical protein EBZ47_04145 [Chlamydiae bacterium]|nr:hypothetical protein [Chlamydiota bacterium]
MCLPIQKTICSKLATLASLQRPQNSFHQYLWKGQTRSLSLLGLKDSHISQDPLSPRSSEAKKTTAADINERGTAIIEELRSAVNIHFPLHPFTHKVSAGNSEEVMGKYMAMSQAFPFIQAGAYKDLVLRAIHRSQPISEEVEKTFVIGTFLCWDETGSQYLLQQEGMSALPKILDTKTQFHANLLRKDLQIIFNHTVEPNYCSDTQTYLLQLMKKLGASNKLERSAMMVAFEMHAERMIQELWKSLADSHSLQKENLIYFEAHVGGDDPAEAYHVALTQKLVQDLVSPKEKEEFFRFFMESYALNVSWCETICK